MTIRAKTTQEQFNQLTDSLNKDDSQQIIKNKDENPKYLLKLADINKILDWNNEKKESVQQYRTTFLTEQRKDARENMLNARRENISKVESESSNLKSSNTKGKNIKEEVSTIVLVDIRSDVQDDIIYCNDKPLQVEKLSLKSGNKPIESNSEYIEDYYYLDIENADYSIERVKGRVYINASVHDSLAPYFYPSGDMCTHMYDNQRDITQEPDSEEIEEQNDPDNYDSNAEYNSGNDYPDEKNYTDDDENHFSSSEDDDGYDAEKLTMSYFENDFRSQIKKKIYTPSAKTDEINEHSDDDDSDSF